MQEACMRRRGCCVQEACIRRRVPSARQRGRRMPTHPQKHAHPMRCMMAPTWQAITFLHSCARMCMHAHAHTCAQHACNAHSMHSV